MARLILMRHSLSVWNEQERFTGWADVDLANRGVEEATQSAESLRRAALVPQVVHTSRLRRAVRTAEIILERLDLVEVPLMRSWQLNERHYGLLQGMTHQEACERFGRDAVNRLRRSAREAPDPDGGAGPLGGAESFVQVQDRVRDYWERMLEPEIARGRTVLCVAHGTSVRSLISILEGLERGAAAALEVATGEARLYEWLDIGTRDRPVRRPLDVIARE